MGGWIKVWRDEAERYGIPEGTLNWWLDLKMNLAWRDEVQEGPQGQPIELKAGEGWFSQRALAKKWGIGRNTLRRWLAKTQAMSLVDTLDKGSYTLYSMTCKSDVVLSEPLAEPQAIPHSEPLAEPQAIPLLHYREEDKEDKKEEAVLNFPDQIFKARAVEVPIFEKIRLKSKGMTEREKKLARVDENTPDMQRMNRLFGRREDTKWTYYLAEGLAKFGELEEEEWRALEVYYARRDTAEKEHRYLRSKLDQLINNLPDDIETARAWCRRNNRTIAFESVEQTNDAGEFYLDPESVIG